MIRRLAASDRPQLLAFLAAAPASSLFLAERAHRDPLGPGWSGAFEGDVLAGVAHLAHGEMVVRTEHPEVAVHAARGARVCSLFGPAEQVWACERALGLEARTAVLRSEEQLYALPLDQMHPVTNAAEVRTALSGDLPRLYALAGAYRAEVLGREPDDALTAGEKDGVDRRVRAGRSFIIERGDALVARCTFNARTPDAVQVGGVYVWPAHRNQGFARAVVAGALVRARDEGARRAVLFTANPAAARSYAALGFTRVGDVGIAVYR
ncbi:MAG: GNAT family N-acetyltransferase [Deltaproteobacteria bacterium]|nr:MAG: GNAT family N-acetyltransferase [Deltaproteobacteria bacterium]